MLWLTSSLTTEDQFLRGWHIPFLFSIALIIGGYVTRRIVEESPVFQ